MFTISFSSLEKSQLLELNTALKLCNVSMVEAEVKNTEVGYFVTIDISKEKTIEVFAHIPSIESSLIHIWAK